MTGDGPIADYPASCQVGGEAMILYDDKSVSKITEAALAPKLAAT